MRLPTCLAACLALGCGMPRDVEGTLDRVRNARMYVGVIDQAPWSEVEKSRPPKGLEPALAKEFARTLNADIEWRTGRESELVELLYHGRLDLLIGGLTDDAPWSDRAGFSRPYVTTYDALSGTTKRHVWAVAPGENRWLLVIDAFLQQQREAAKQFLQQRTARKERSS